MLVLVVVWALSLAYASRFVDRGWIPHDEGMLGQNAERVLRGELPHRDYDETYTGGLTYLHARAFRLLGLRLISLRLVLFLFIAAWVPLLYALAVRRLPPVSAGLLTLVAVGWSVPNYFASIPSWYVLFFATAGTYALFREAETGRRRWLLVAGVCAGLSLVTIVVGLYVVAAVLLYLAFREVAAAQARPPSPSAPWPLFFFFQAAACAGFLLALFWLVRSRTAPMDLWQLVVPPAAVVAALLVRAWAARGRGRPGERFRWLLERTLIFGAGAAIPIAVFLVPYIASGSLGALYRGLFVLPFRQIEAATVPFPPFASVGAVLPYAALLAFSSRLSPGRARVVGLALAAPLAVILFLSGSPDVYRGVWHSARSLGVLAVLFGCWRLSRRQEPRAPSRTAELETFLLVAMTALLGLLQFPFASPLYFCYLAPFVALTLGALVRDVPRAPFAAVALFYLAFAVLWLNPGYVRFIGIRYMPYRPLAPLDLPRAGIRVPPEDAATYEAVAEAVERRSPGPFLYAAPDCPEIGFLTGRRHPDGVVFDFLREPPRPDEVLGMLEEKGARVVVINTRPDYSPPLSPAVLEVLESRFPSSETIGKFVVRWRE